MRLIDADELLETYDQMHIGPPGIERIMITKARTMMEWVSVEEKLPEGRGLYLVFDGDNVFASEYVPGRKEGEWTEDIEEYLTFEVTHWMPLPKPPREKPGEYRIGGAVIVTDEMIGTADPLEDQVQAGIAWFRRMAQRGGGDE